MRRVFVLLAASVLLIGGVTVKRGPQRGPVDRSFFLDAGILLPSTDTETACSGDPAAHTLTTAQAPDIQVYAFSCDTLGGDGSIQGRMTLPPTFQAGSEITVEIHAVYNQAGPDNKTGHGVLYAKCAGDGDSIPAWTTSTDADVAWSSAVLGDAEVISPAITPDGSCVAGDDLFIRYRVCRESAAVSPCDNSSVDAWTNAAIFGLNVIFKSVPGD